MFLGAILLLIAALALVVGELIIPTHGLLAILAAGCAVGAVALAYQTHPLVALLMGIIIVAASPAVFLAAVRIYPKTKFGKKVLLDHPIADSGFNRESDELTALIGQQGTALSRLRPAGSIDVKGQIIDALSDGEIIDSGTKVEIVRVSGLKVFVKPA